MAQSTGGTLIQVWLLVACESLMLHGGSQLIEVVFSQRSASPVCTSGIAGLYAGLPTTSGCSACGRCACTGHTLKGGHGENMNKMSGLNWWEGVQAPVVHLPLG